MATFEEKLEASISSHQKRKSTLPSIQRKRKKIGIISVALSTPLDEQNIETIIGNLDNYLFDDVMLLVWCERTTFHQCEPMKNNGRRVIFVLRTRRKDAIAHAHKLQYKCQS